LGWIKLNGFKFMILNQISIKKGRFSGTIGSTWFLPIADSERQWQGVGLRAERGTGNETAMSCEINAINRTDPFASANTDSTHPRSDRQNRVERSVVNLQPIRRSESAATANCVRNSGASADLWVHSGREEGRPRHQESDPGKASRSLIKKDIVGSVFENKAEKRPIPCIPLWEREVGHGTKKATPAKRVGH